jgi:uncharacterized coiled-coil protein SlyX
LKKKLSRKPQAKKTKSTRSDNFDFSLLETLNELVAVLKGHREVVAELQKQVAALYARTKYSEQQPQQTQQPQQWPSWPLAGKGTYTYAVPYYVDCTNSSQHLYGHISNKPAGSKQLKNK